MAKPTTPFAFVVLTPNLEPLSWVWDVVILRFLGLPHDLLIIGGSILNPGLTVSQSFGSRVAGIFSAYVAENLATEK